MRMKIKRVIATISIISLTLMSLITANPGIAEATTSSTMTESNVLAGATNVTDTYNIVPVSNDTTNKIIIAQQLQSFSSVVAANITLPALGGATISSVSTTTVNYAPDGTHNEISLPALQINLSANVTLNSNTSYQFLISNINNNASLKTYTQTDAAWGDGTNVYNVNTYGATTKNSLATNVTTNTSTLNGATNVTDTFVIQVPSQQTITSLSLGINFQDYSSVATGNVSISGITCTPTSVSVDNSYAFFPILKINFASTTFPTGTAITINIANIKNTGTPLAYFHSQAVYYYNGAFLPAYNANLTGSTVSTSLSNNASNAANVTETFQMNLTKDMAANSFLAIQDNSTNLANATLSQVSSTGIASGITAVYKATSAFDVSSSGNALVLEIGGLTTATTDISITVTGLTTTSTAGTYPVLVGYNTGSWVTGSAATWGTGGWEPASSGSGVSNTISSTSFTSTVKVAPSMSTSISVPTSSVTVIPGQSVNETATVSVLTNASSYTVSVSATPLTKTSDSKVFPDIANTFASPGAFPDSSAGYGWTVLSTNQPSFVPAQMHTNGTTWCKFNHVSQDTVLNGNSPTGSATTMTLGIQMYSDWSVESGTYTSNVQITVNPTFSN